jgi:aryl-alcohol dehydrogenase-like predicted oxidoreductase
MQYTQLGRIGAKVSRLALGTMNFGWHTDEKDSRTIMDAALEAGVNFFDTADIYGAGASESILGRWFADDPSRRDEVVLATKLYIPLEDGPNTGGLSALHIRKACEDSLRRLQTDHIDLYQFHHIDRTTPWEEIWEATERLVATARWSTSAVATSPAGTSPPRRRQRRRATSSAWPPSSRCTT